MNIDVELDIYKSLVMLLDSDQDTISNTIARLLDRLNQMNKPPVTATNAKDSSYWYQGRWHCSRKAIDTYLNFLEILSLRSNTFLDGFAKNCLALNNARPYIAKTKEALYPDNPELKENAKKLSNWWIDGNINNKQKFSLMHLAAKTAGLSEGTDYKLSLPNAG